MRWISLRESFVVYDIALTLSRSFVKQRIQFPHEEDLAEAEANSYFHQAV